MHRPNGSIAATEMLPPVFGAKTTTAGNAPGLNDGSSAIVVMTEKKAKELGLTILGTVVDQVGDTDMPYGISWIPASAIKKILSRTGNTIDDIDLIEINEAFAAMPLVSTRILSENDDKKWYERIKKTNVNDRYRRSGQHHRRTIHQGLYHRHVNHANAGNCSRI